MVYSFDVIQIVAFRPSPRISRLLANSGLKVARLLWRIVIEAAHLLGSIVNEPRWHLSSLVNLWLLNPCIILPLVNKPTFSNDG